MLECLFGDSSTVSRNTYMHKIAACLHYLHEKDSDYPWQVKFFFLNSVLCLPPLTEEELVEIVNSVEKVESAEVTAYE